MNGYRLPKEVGLPDGITRDKPAKNLAALCSTPALAVLQKTLVMEWQHRAQFAELEKFGIGPIRQVLFHGPPGNGKTMACQLLAHKLEVPLYRVCCEELVKAYIGQCAQNVSAVMNFLAVQPACVVLFDEVESLFPARGRTTDLARELSSAMSVFWQHLDRWEAPTLFVLATNLREQLDPALLSRLELQLEFGPPTPQQVAEVVAYWQEVLHRYGAEAWGPQLVEQSFESFRALWQAINRETRSFVRTLITEGKFS